VEHVIERTKLIQPKKAVDYNLGDIVKCSYMPGLFRVTDVFGTCVIIYHIGADVYEYEQVEASFLEKVEINKDTLEVLFNDKP
jgi:hypothetical protein